MEGIRQALQEADIVATVTGLPQIFHVALGLREPPTNYRDVLAVDRQGYIQLTTALLQRGVRALERGSWFLSTEHDDKIVETTIEIFRDAVTELRRP
jgi:glutamate-1-semialdehyde 2,1-aminomutase